MTEHEHEHVCDEGKVLKLLQAARFLLLQKMPYLSSLLYSLVFIKRNDFPAKMGVTDTGICYINYHEIENCTVPDVAFMLFHELGHVMRKSGKRTDDLVSTVAPDSVGFFKMISNIAADMPINADARRANFAVGTGYVNNAPLNLCGFERYCSPDKLKDLPDNLMHQEYYAILCDMLSEDTKQKLQGGGGKELEDQLDSNDVGSGGGCSHGSDEQGDNSPESSIGKQHQRTAAEMERILRSTAEAIKSYNERQPGQIPGGMQLWAQDLVKPSVVPWQTKLRLAVRYGVDRAMGATESTWRNPSKKQPALGYGHRSPIAPSFFAHTPNVEFVFDTSGSMGSELERGVIECHAIANTIKGRVSFVAIDAAIQRDVKVRNISEIVKNLVGGGGTVFTELFERYNRMRKEAAPAVVVCWTDAAILGLPANKPKNIRKWIWLLPEGCEAPVSWGEVITVTKQ